MYRFVNVCDIYLGYKMDYIHNLATTICTKLNKLLYITGVHVNSDCFLTPKSFSRKQHLLILRNNKLYIHNKQVIEKVKPCYMVNNLNEHCFYIINPTKLN